jgi:hypothetical protein
MPSVYIETSIVSYLTARRSRDVIAAGKQELTRVWWRGRSNYSLVTSEVVLKESAAGDPQASERRLKALRGIAVLHSTAKAEELADDLVRLGAMPAVAIYDAGHVSIAAVHDVEYLLTWNLKHIANAVMRARIEEICRSAGLRPPIICTPAELDSLGTRK